MDTNCVVFNTIVDGERKSFGTHEIIAEVKGMNACELMQRFDVGQQGFEKVTAHARALPFVESKSVKKVLFRLGEESNSHCVAFRSRSRTSAKSENPVCPS